MTLFRVAGISVGVHVSWLIIFGLVTWSLGRVTVAEIMGGRDGMVTTAPGSTLLYAAQTLASHDFDQLSVVENGRILGLLTRADILRFLQVREALGRGDAGPAGPNAPAGSDAAVTARGRP